MTKPYVMFVRESDDQVIMGFAEYDSPIPRKGELVDTCLGFHRVLDVVHSPSPEDTGPWIKIIVEFTEFLRWKEEEKKKDQGRE